LKIEIHLQSQRKYLQTQRNHLETQTIHRESHTNHREITVVSQYYHIGITEKWVVDERLMLRSYFFYFLFATKKSSAIVLNDTAKKYEIYGLIIRMLLVYSCIQEQTSLCKFVQVCENENKRGLVKTIKNK
jgi:hypothetical protein